MSWMDSWSRPRKDQAVPPPFYLTRPESVKYCHTCGRVISPRKSHKTESSTPAKYCSSRCRCSKPGALDRRIVNAFVALLEGRTEFEGEAVSSEILDMKLKGKGRGKGDQREIIPCSAIETLVFGTRKDESKIYGRKKNRASRAIGAESEVWKSVDMVSSDEESHGSEHQAEGKDDLIHFIPVGFAGKVRPPQAKTDVNASVGGEKGWAERSEETEEAAKKRKEGQRIAVEKEMVKRAARRGCVFGFALGSTDETIGKSKTADVEGGKRLCEAIMNGTVVEPSFAKGDWGIRWRE